MVYDENLMIRLRRAVGPLDGLSEKKMMGGACIMLNGNMIGGADRSKEGEGRFLIRVGKDQTEEALALPGAQVTEMGGRRMGGFVTVGEVACDDAGLRDFVGLALKFVKTLPPK